MKYRTYPSLLSSEQSDLPPLIPREILFSEPVVCSPQLSPDGKKISYLAPVNNVMNLWIKTVGKQNDIPLTDFKSDTIASYLWATDKYIFYIQDKDGNENWLLYKLDVERRETCLLTPCKKGKFASLHCCNRDDFPGELIFSMTVDDRKVPDLFHVNLNTNKLTLIDKNPGNITRWLIDHSFRIRGIVVSKDSGDLDFLVKDNEGKDWKKLFTWNMESRFLSRALRFTRDNKYIYLIDAGNYNTSRLLKLELDTGKIDVLASHDEYDVYINLYDSINYRYEPVTLLTNPKTYEIDGIAFDKFRREWIILNEAIKEDFKVIRELDRGDFSIISCDDSNNVWIAAFEKDNGPVSYYIFDRNAKKGTFLFYNNPALNDYTMAPMEEVIFKSRDNLTLHGYVTYPAGVKREKLPFVLLVHKGPWLRDLWGYNPTVQWLANRGYACLQINYRGSVGYGKEFFNAGNKEWGGKMQDDLIDAINMVVEEGMADPARIAIYGSGYGGYAALTGATFTPDFFCCAVAIQCPGNLITFLEAVPPFLQGRREMVYKRVGDPYKDRDLLISRSPFYRLEQIKIPLLIAYGLNSSRIKSSEPYKIVQSIKSKGISVEHIVFPDEGHEIIKQENRLKFYAVTERFLAKYMGGRYESREIHMKDIYFSAGNNRDSRFIIDKILKEGDKSAFETLIDLYRKPLLKHLFNLTGDPDLSKDLLQETFYRVWLYLGTYSSFDKVPFSSWLFKIATNVAYKHRIKNSKLKNETSLDDIDPSVITERWDETIEDKIFAHSVINSLKDPYKTSMLLRFMGDLDYKEIASCMNTDPNSIKTYLFRAKKSILKSFNNK